MFASVAYMLYTIDCPHIPRTTHYFNKERTITMKIHFAYYNQYKNGIDIAFADNTLLFLSCAEAEKNLHTTPNSQRLIDNLAIAYILTLCNYNQKVIYIANNKINF